jgi:hypothetical protein
MQAHCPEVDVMRKLRAQAKVGVEFTGWPTRPKPTPLRGPTLPDRRWPPIDLVEGSCRGRCGYAAPRSFKRTQKGAYHK